MHESSLTSDGFGNRLLDSRELFKSRRGSMLPAEICLKIVEDVLSLDPEGGSWVLKTLSKSFNILLRSYEHSIVKTVSENEGTERIFSNTLLSSWPRNRQIPDHSYTWLSEVRYRKHAIESLIRHEVTGMVPTSDGRGTIDLLLPAEVPEPELSSRVERFKRDAIHLLYGIADCTAALPDADAHSIRARQVSHLESLTTTQLAVLGVMSRVLGLAYFRSTKAQLPKRTSDSLRDRWIVFEDRILRHGPFLAWATVVETKGEAHEWASGVIADALGDMEAFETGKVRGYASLQSVLWRLFCVRTGCDVFDGWEEARGVVEVEMMSYEL